jgi:hypothetical protein
MGYECIFKCVNSDNDCNIGGSACSIADGASYLFTGKYDKVRILSNGTVYYIV